jgi:predicted N-acyltransferase
MTADIVPLSRYLAEAPPSPRLYHSPRWLAVEERCADVPPFYVVAAEGGARAALPCYGFTAASNPWAFARPDLYLAQLLGTEASMPALPGWTLGGRRPGHSSLVLAGENRADRMAAATDAVGAVVREATRRGARSVMALYVEEDDVVFGAALAEQGFLKLPTYRRWEVELPGRSFADYLAALPSGRRSGVGKERRRLAAAGLRSRVVALDERLLPRLIELELQGYERFGHRYDPREARRLHQAGLQELAGSAYVSLVEDGDVVVGYSVIVRSGDTWHVRQGGEDREAIGRLPVYFETTFYGPIEHAYATGARRVDLSITSDDTKSSRGARPVATAAHVLLLDPAEHAALRSRAADSAQAAS